MDIAFNNAGTEGQFTPFVDQTNEIYNTIFNANVRGVFWSMKYEAKTMLAQGSGTIINNASMGGVIGFPNAALYIASKHAVLGLTKTASLEWFKAGVRVNSICPGLIDTPFQDRVWGSEKAKNDFGAASVAGRMGTSEEMAKVVAFLASDDSTFVSGHGLLARTADTWFRDRPVGCCRSARRKKEQNEIKRSRFSEEQIIAILKEAEGEPVKTVCARHNIRGL